MTRRRIPDQRWRSDNMRKKLQPWVNAVSAVIYMLVAAVDTLISAPFFRWLIVVFVFNSLLHAAMAFTYVTDWHGWGRRLWTWKPWGTPMTYARPTGARVCKIALVAVAVALTGNAIIIARVTLT